MTREELGHRLKALRNDKEVSQEEMAERSGLSNTTIGAIETGNGRCSLDALLKYMNALSYEIVFRHLGTGRDV